MPKACWSGSRSSWRAPSQTRRAAPSSTLRARGSLPPPTRLGGGSSATSTTGLSSDSSRLRSRSRAAQASVPPDLGELRAELSRIVEGHAGVLDELREIAQGIHPAGLADGGLGPALRTLARRSP